ncbi:MAG: class II fructose-bisphosphatase [candidate division NC10 bacterium]|nr:class II fructose-bisphosphatase [candidate division NC10 bacterium]
MERNLALEAVRVTEAAALSSARWMGLGNEKAADQAAVDAMRRTFDAVDFDGTVVIGKGERGETPMLYIGEKLGTGNPPEVNVALDPLEGTNIVAEGRANAIAAVAIAEKDTFVRLPNTYMEKIAVGPKAAKAIDLKKGPEENLHRIAEAMRCHVEDLTVAILDRPRHAELIQKVRGTGARIKLLQDGDLQAAIATAFEGTEVDVLMGIGGVYQGILGAAALRCLGGDMQARLRPRDGEEVDRALKMGIRDIDQVYKLLDLIRGKDVMFAATGVTDGDLLRGVRFFGGGARTYSVVMRLRSGTIRFIEASHHFDRAPLY